MAAPGGGKRGQRPELVGQTLAREACTPRGERAGDGWAKRPEPIPARCPGCSAAGRAHLRVAAEAARRVSAGLGVHAQRAGPVEVQAAGAGLQEGHQVLVDRVLLRWPGRQRSQPEKGTISGPLRNHVSILQGWQALWGGALPGQRLGAEILAPAAFLRAPLTWPRAQMLRTRMVRAPRPTRKEALGGKTTSS